MERSISFYMVTKCDDSWVGEAVAFSPTGNRCAEVYTTLADGSNRVTVVLRNNTRDWLEVKKGVPITWMVATN